MYILILSKDFKRVYLYFKSIMNSLVIKYEIFNEYFMCYLQSISIIFIGELLSVDTLENSVYSVIDV